MQKPLVLIVGRPNVGKSTLFNRLTKTNASIVDDFSGVTRDRLFGDVEWNDKSFKLVDTGGYVPESDNIFELAIKEQIEIGIEEASAMLFVVDARDGLTPVDKEIAHMLRSSSIPVFILVNKSDNDAIGINKNEFYQLGFDNVYDISALNGRNLGDVLDDLIKSITFPDVNLLDDDRLKIAILGRPNVGKSSLTNALLGYNRSMVTNIPGTTRDSINAVFKFYGEEIVLVDTAGLRKKARVKENIEFYSNVRTYRAIAECDVALILVDSQLGVEKQDLKIVDEAERRKKGIIIAVNKWDLIEKETNTSKNIEDKIKEKLGKYNFIPIKFISAKTKQRIFKLIELAKTIQNERSKKISTSKLNDLLLQEFKSFPPPATSKGKVVSIKFIQQVGDKYPLFLIFTNEPKEIPDNYRRFIENSIRKHFNFEGVSITISLKQA